MAQNFSGWPVSGQEIGHRAATSQPCSRSLSPTQRKQDAGPLGEIWAPETRGPALVPHTPLAGGRGRTPSSLSLLPNRRSPRYTGSVPDDEAPREAPPELQPPSSDSVEILLQESRKGVGHNPTVPSAWLSPLLTEVPVAVAPAKPAMEPAPPPPATGPSADSPAEGSGG